MSFPYRMLGFISAVKAQQLFASLSTIGGPLIMYLCLHRVGSFATQLDE